MSERIDDIEAPDIIARRLAAIVESSDDAILSKDLKGIISSWNGGAERIFGYTADEMIGASILKLIPTELHPEEIEIVSRLQKGERVDHYETIRVAKNGRRLNVSITVSPIKDSTGRIIGASKVARNITERKQTEAALNRAREAAEAARLEAETANRLKDEFLATLSHELRTPLNAILGWAAVLRRSKAEGEELDKGLATIERNARAQAQIIEDLLDMSRIISGKVRLDVQRADLPGILQEALETVRAAADAREIQILPVIDPQASPVSGDPARLQQIFWNLFSNAIKFTPKGGRIQILLERVDSCAEISVIDNGEGIAPEFLPHVFDRFQQADGTTSRRHGGLGLGLAIVKQLVGLHGGNVHARSEGPGKGTTFVVRLPLAVIRHGLKEGQTYPCSPSDKAEAVPDISLAGTQVLVVDDESDARTLVRQLLELAGASVITAGSADEAMRCLLSGEPDVLISDIGMPEVDGYSFIRNLRVVAPRLPALALTAYARAEDRTKAIRAGFDNHLAKPVDAAELLAVVERMAGISSAK